MTILWQLRKELHLGMRGIYCDFVNRYLEQGIAPAGAMKKSCMLLQSGGSYGATLKRVNGRWQSAICHSLLFAEFLAEYIGYFAEGAVVFHGFDHRGHQVGAVPGGESYLCEGCGSLCTVPFCFQRF